MGFEFEDVFYYTEVRWLSDGQMLKDFTLSELKLKYLVKQTGNLWRRMGFRFIFFSRHHISGKNSLLIISCKQTKNSQVSQLK